MKKLFVCILYLFIIVILAGCGERRLKTGKVYLLREINILVVYEGNESCVRIVNTPYIIKNINFIDLIDQDKYKDNSTLNSSYN